MVLGVSGGMMARNSTKMLILHDWLNVKNGGAELVLYELLKMYPEADVATLIYNRRMFGSRLRGRRVKVSFLQYFPGFLKRHPYLLLPWVRRAVERIDTRGYDIVLAASSAWVKNVRLQPRQRCVVYCYSPARMLWDSWPQAMNQRTSNPFVKLYVTRIVSALRLWDYYSAQSSQRDFVAISETIARRIKKFYHRQAEVIMPPVEQPPTIAVDREDYWVIVSVLSVYKNIDLAIEACRKSGERLVIVGDGPDKERLMQLAAGLKNIEFRGRVDDQEKWRVMSAARGFLFCSIEDFGIAPVEALGCGTPVVALRAGGVAETITDGKSGILYDEPTVESLSQAMAVCKKKQWNAHALRKAALQYRPELFRTQLSTVIHEVHGQ